MYNNDIHKFAGMVLGSTTRGGNQLRYATNSESGSVSQGERDCRGAAGVVQVFLNIFTAIDYNKYSIVRIEVN